MNKKQVKAELAKIMQQQTVSINRLKKVLNVLNYAELERAYINQGGSIKALRNRDKRRIEQVKNLERIIERQRITLNRLQNERSKSDEQRTVGL